MLAIRLSDVNTPAKIVVSDHPAQGPFVMSVLAVFAFSKTSTVIRHRFAQWASALLFSEVPLEIPCGRPSLLRDAGINGGGSDAGKRARLTRDAVYRSHWLV